MILEGVVALEKALIKIIFLFFGELRCLLRQIEFTGHVDGLKFGETRCCKDNFSHSFFNIFKELSYGFPLIITFILLSHLWCCYIRSSEFDDYLASELMTIEVLKSTRNDGDWLVMSYLSA